MVKLQEDIKKMINDVPVPTEKLNKTVLESLNVAKKTQKPPFINKPKFLASIASIFILAIGALLLNSFLGDATTSDTPNGSILENNGDEGLQLMVREGKVKRLALESEDQNIKVFLKEGFLDNHQLALSYYIEFDDPYKKPETTNIDLELFVNNHSDGISYFSGMNTKQLMEKGDILKFYNTEGFPATSNLEIRIHKINDIEGEWSFSFTLQKENEYVDKSDPIVKEDSIGNKFAVNKAQLTPSMLMLMTRTEVKLVEPLPANSYLELSLIAIGSDGTMYPEKAQRSTSHHKDAYDQIVLERILNEKIELPRSVNAYSYKLVPYITTYKGKEVPSTSGKAYIWDNVTAPFLKGTILHLNSNIKVLDIRKDFDRTVVHYHMDPLQPVFPNIRNKETDEMYEAISFKHLPNHVEVSYPKVSNEESLEFTILDASYKVFSDLEITIDLKD